MKSELLEKIMGFGLCAFAFVFVVACLPEGTNIYFALLIAGVVVFISALGGSMLGA